MSDRAPAERLERTLDLFLADGERPVDLLAALVAEMRPARRKDTAHAPRAFHRLCTVLAEREDYRRGVQRALRALFDATKQVSFYAESGLLPNAGFFSELWRRIAHRLLPEKPDPAYLRDCIDLIFCGARDHEWLDSLAHEDRIAFWQLMSEAEEGAPTLNRAIDQMVDAVQILSVRIAAMGVERELLRVLPDLDEFDSPFMGLDRETRRFLDAYRRTGDGPEEDEKQVLVMIDQCRDVVNRARRTASRVGTSLELTYLLRRLEQSLERLDLLVALLAARFGPEGREVAVPRWTAFFRSAVKAEIQRNGVRSYFGALTRMLALRVTENAGRTGEHYVTTDRAGWFAMWRSALGAGVIIGCMALVKLLASKLDLAPLNMAFVYSLNYAAGFVLVHVLHFTIATKQPAMTAATLAAAIGAPGGRLNDSGRLADLSVDVVRSQIAAILGNVLMAFPIALLLGLGLTWLHGGAIMSVGKAHQMLEELYPLRSLALLHAAIAGVWLFLSGLVSGYFDNRAAYYAMGGRIADLRWLRALLGRQRASRLGEFIDANLGGIAGNVFFGVMLGSTWLVGSLVGLPLDIRHVAFASANLALGLVGTGFEVDWHALAVCAGGVALIGIVNLTVSFTLALWTAMRSRGVALRHIRVLGRALWTRFKEAPARFLLPLAPSAAATREPAP
ncbi:MAG TPA: site-specific recombinase [Pelomicrobium sp.]|nr:site-specific recombinase [Pelomicrobium sp.]